MHLNFTFQWGLHFSTLAKSILTAIQSSLKLQLLPQHHVEPGFFHVPLVGNSEKDNDENQPSEKMLENAKEKFQKTNRKLNNLGLQLNSPARSGQLKRLPYLREGLKRVLIYLMKNTCSGCVRTTQMIMI